MYGTIAIAAVLDAAMALPSAAPAPASASVAASCATLLAQLLGSIRASEAAEVPQQPITVDAIVLVRAAVRELLPSVSADAPLLSTGVPALDALLHALPAPPTRTPMKLTKRLRRQAAKATKKAEKEKEQAEAGGRAGRKISVGARRWATAGK